MTRFRITDENLAERFWMKVVKGEGDGCWVWRTPGHDYPKVTTPDGMRRANRVAWEIANGPIPPGLFVCHTCDNRRCVRPDHLFLGSNTDNMRDMAAKGRDGRSRHPERYAHTTGDGHYTRTRPHLRVFGQRHGRAKLSNAQVAEIRAAAQAGETQRSIAARYGVSQTAVSNIVSGRKWRWTGTVEVDTAAAVQGIAALEQRITELRSWPGDFTAEIAAAHRLLTTLRATFGIRLMTEAELDARHEAAMAELDEWRREEGLPDVPLAYDPAEGSHDPAPALVSYWERGA